MGIGVAFFTKAVGAGPRKEMDLAGLAMSDGCDLTINPTGTAVVRISVQTQGQGHETSAAQVVARGVRCPVHCFWSTTRFRTAAVCAGRRRAAEARADRRCYRTRVSYAGGTR